MLGELFELEAWWKTDGSMSRNMWKSRYCSRYLGRRAVYDQIRGGPK